MSVTCLDQSNQHRHNSHNSCSDPLHNLNKTQAFKHKHTIQYDSNIDMYACMNAPISFTQEHYVKMWYLMLYGVYMFGGRLWF